MKAVEEVAASVGVKEACEALGVPRATYYRQLRPRATTEKSKRNPPARALTEVEREEVLELLDSERFVDKAPAQVYATLLDEGEYLCSISTMYRILAESNQVRERRDQLRHPSYAKPELLATRPNMVWSWDITKLLGPRKWTYYHLYVILDIFSRYVVGWLVADRESAALAERLIEETLEKQGIGRAELTLHADRGVSMRSKRVAQLLADLGVTKTHSRPYTSTDNPFSEAQFKTLKYRPDFPMRLGSLEDAQVFCREFFRWYNQEHRHSALGLLTPECVHYGLASEVRDHRQAVLERAYERTPERFVHGRPQAPQLPTEAWINKPPSSAARGDDRERRQDAGNGPDAEGAHEVTF